MGRTSKRGKQSTVGKQADLISANGQDVFDFPDDAGSSSMSGTPRRKSTRIAASPAKGLQEIAIFSAKKKHKVLNTVARDDSSESDAQDAGRPRESPRKYADPPVEVKESRLRPRKSGVPSPRAPSPTNEGTQVESDESEDEESETDAQLSGEDSNTIFAEKILAQRTRAGKVQYLVKWEGFSHDADEWLPADEVDSELVEEYDASMSNTRRPLTIKRDQTYLGDGSLSGDDQDSITISGKRSRQSTGGIRASKKAAVGHSRAALPTALVSDSGSDEPARKKGKGGTKGKGKKAATSRTKAGKGGKAHAAQLEREIQERIAAQKDKVCTVSAPKCSHSDRDPSTPVDQIDYQCCTVCSSREYARAVVTGNHPLLESCLADITNTPPCSWGVKPDTPIHTAFYMAAVANDTRSLGLLLNRDPVYRSRIEPKDHQCHSPSNTGYVSNRSYGRQIRSVNESRGNREGNNAFYKTSNCDPLAKLARTGPPKGRSSNDAPDYAAQKLGISWDVLNRIVAYPDLQESTIDLVMVAPTLGSDLTHMLQKNGVYEAAAAGNLHIARHLVQAFENGHGFNKLHIEVLKITEHESLTPYRKNQILKKATENSGITPLELAAINPCTKFLKELFEEVSEYAASEQDARGRTCLHFAAGATKPDALEYLLSKGMDPSVADFTRLTPLLLAAKYGREKNIAILLAATQTVGADHTLLKEAYTALHYAAHYGHVQSVTKLLQAGASPSAVIKKTKFTALHLAAAAGLLDIVRILIGAGGDVTAADTNGQTVLHVAVKNGHFDVAKFLLDQGSDANGRDISDNTPIHYAAGFGWPSLIQLLVSYGDADPNVPNNWKYSPLMVADMKGHTRCVSTLLALPNIEVNHRDNDGISMLHRCMYEEITSAKEAKRLLQKLTRLLEHKADVNIRNLKGETPLHILAATKSTLQANANSNAKEVLAYDLSDWWRTRKDMLKIFFKQPDIEHNAVSKTGETPLALALKHGSDPMINLLLDHSADVEIARYGQGDTILHYAFHIAAKAGVRLFSDKLKGINVGKVPFESKISSQLMAKLQQQRDVLIKMLGTANDAGYPPLVAAVKFHVEALKSLQSQSKSSSKAGSKGLTCRWEQLQIVMRLLSGSDDLTFDEQVQLPKDHPHDQPPPNELGFTSLHFAAQYHQSELVRTLCDFGSCADGSLTGNLRTPLYLALSGLSENCQAGTIKERNSCVSFLLQHGANPARLCIKLDGSTDTPLLLVANLKTDPFSQTKRNAGAAPGQTMSEQIVSLEKFVSHSSGMVDFAPSSQKTALMHFVRRQLLIPATSLINLGADTSRVDENDSTVVSVAVQSRNVKLVEATLLNRPSLALADKDGNTPLHHAARLAEDRIILLLLEKGTDLNVDKQNKSGETALHIACRLGSAIAVEGLLTAKSSWKLKSCRGTTALMEAAKTGSVECIAHLVKAGIVPEDVNDKDGDGEYVLHHAVRSMKWRAVKLLLDSGGDPMVKNQIDLTPLHVAVQKSKNAVNTSLKIERLLIEKGASINAVDCQGRTPLHIAFVNAGFIPAMAKTEKMRADMDIWKCHLKELEEQKTEQAKLVQSVALQPANVTEDDKWIAAVNVKVHERESAAAARARDAAGRAKISLQQYEVLGREWLTELWEDSDIATGQIKADPIEVVNWLLERDDIAIDVPDIFGRTLLHYAARCGAFTCCNYFLERGSRIAALDADGNSPMQLAMLHQHADLAAMLVDKGATSLGSLCKVDGAQISTFQYSLLNGFMSMAFMTMQGQGLPFLDSVHAALSTGKYHIAELLIAKASSENADHKSLPLVCCDFEPTLPDQWEEYSVIIFEMLHAKGFNMAFLDQKTLRTPLHCVAQYAHSTVIDLLLPLLPQNTLPTLDNSGRSALSYALEARSSKICKALLAKYQEWPTNIVRSGHGPSLMLQAVQLGDADIVDRMIACKIAVDDDTASEDNGGYPTPLMAAIVNKNNAIVKFLVAAGADVNKPSIREFNMTEKDKFIILHPIFESLTSTQAIRQELFAAGAQVNVCHPKSGQTPLHLAFAMKDANVVLELIKAGADVTQHDPETGESFLQHVLFASEAKNDVPGQFRRWELIKQAQIARSPELFDFKSGQTLLDLAIWQDDRTAVTRLLSLNVDVNLKSKPEANPDGLTSLMVCARRNNMDAFLAILSHFESSMDDGGGIMWNVTDNKGRTVVHHIVQPQTIASFENVTMLRKAVFSGADLEVSDKTGQRPMHYAKLQTSNTMLAALFGLGAQPVNVPSTTLTPVPATTSRHIDVDVANDVEEGRQELRKLAEETRLEKLRKIAASKGMTLEQYQEAKRLQPPPVSPLLNLPQSVAHVVADDHGGFYDIHMTKFDVDRGSHGLGVFYKMQVVHNKVQDLYILFNNWGDVKETGMHQRTPYSNREECIAEFLKIFSAKSGNSWENRTSAFVEKSGKYIPVKAPTHQHVSLKSLDLQDAPPSQLSDGLQDFINIIADLSSVDHAIEATDVDLQVGDFDGDAVRKGYSILLEIRDALAKMSGTGIPDVKALKATRLRILDLTNAYYRLLPKQGIKQPGERRFLDQYNLNKELVKMASLMYLGPGSDFLLAAHTRRKVINPLDYVASALKCNLTELLDRTTDEFRLVNDYMTDSSTDYGIVSLLKVDRAGETERFTPHQHNLNRRLLWHGSGMGNMMGILSQGLRIAPVEASASGYMFGKGVYFADMFKKSINYSAVTWGGKTDGYACLLLCEVALGKCYKTTDAEFLLKPKEGTESTWGHGTQEPSEVIILNDGVKIPRPPIVTTGAADNKGYYWRQRLAHNEFIVYSESQVRIRYVVLVRRSHMCLLCQKSEGKVQPLEQHRERYCKLKDFQLPEGTFKDNKYESEVARALLYHQNLEVTELWDKCLPEALSSQSYTKRWQPVTRMRLNSDVCHHCADKMLEDFIHDIIMSKLDKLPSSVRDRPNCWYGTECRSQGKLSHAKQHCHFYPPIYTSGSLLWAMQPTKVALKNQASLAPATGLINLSGTSDARAKVAMQNIFRQLHQPIFINVTFDIVDEEGRETVEPNVWFAFSGTEGEDHATTVTLALCSKSRTATLVTPTSTVNYTYPPCTDSPNRHALQIVWSPAHESLALQAATRLTSDGLAGDVFEPVGIQSIQLRKVCGNDIHMSISSSSATQIRAWNIWKVTNESFIEDLMGDVPAGGISDANPDADVMDVDVDTNAAKSMAAEPGPNIYGLEFCPSRVSFPGYNENDDPDAQATEEPQAVEEDEENLSGEDYASHLDNSGSASESGSGSGCGSGSDSE